MPPRSRDGKRRERPERVHPRPARRNVTRWSAPAPLHRVPLERHALRLVTAALLHALLHKIRTGRDLGVGAALSRGVKRWGNVFGARFRSGLYILVGILLLVVPGVMWMVKYALTDEIAALDPDRSSSRVLGRSAELTRGHGWTIFAVSLLSAIPVGVLQLGGGMVSGLVDSWVVASLVDCVTDVVYRFFVPVMLLVYLGAGGQAQGAAPAG